MRRLGLWAVGVAALVVGAGAWAAWPERTAMPVAEPAACTTCDARQAGKARLRKALAAPDN
ncbi:MAG: hypothetical protein AAF631_02160 [Pseudomonadota bacterium]